MFRGKYGIVKIDPVDNIKLLSPTKKKANVSETGQPLFCDAIVQLLLNRSRRMAGDCAGAIQTTLPSVKEPGTGVTVFSPNTQRANELSAKFRPNKVIRSPP
jgi:hypothetical protein